MMTIRGWFKVGFDPKSADAGYKFIPGHGSGRDRRSEEHLLFDTPIYLDGLSGRWHFNISNDDRFEVRKELTDLVEFWSLEDYYPNPGLGQYPIVYGPNEGDSGIANYECAGGDRNSKLSIDDCKTIVDLKKLYFAVRRGEAKVVEIWTGKGRNNVTELQERIKELEKCFREEADARSRALSYADELKAQFEAATTNLVSQQKRVKELCSERDNALLQLGKLGTEQAAKDAKIAELNERVEGLYKLRDDLRNEHAGTYTKLTEKTRELADKDGKIHDLDLELRLMKERVRSLMMNIWRDMFGIGGAVEPVAD
jgi:hypothetical protein